MPSTTLDETLPWPEIDRLLVNLRSGVPVAQEELQAPSGLIAQALAGSFALQQYDFLSTFLASLPSEATIGTVVTPARLAATVVEALPPPPPYIPPPPAPQEQGGGVAGDSTGSAARGPDNPGGAQH